MFIHEVLFKTTEGTDESYLYLRETDNSELKRIKKQPPPLVTAPTYRQ